MREKLKSKANNKKLRARTCAAFFLVFLKCTLEKRQASQKFTSTVLSTHQEKKVGASQEIKFQGPEEAKRGVKKFKQVDRIKKIVKDVNSKSR